MNTERLNLLADVLESEQFIHHVFSMDDWGYRTLGTMMKRKAFERPPGRERVRDVTSCNTTLCIAGLTVALFGEQAEIEALDARDITDRKNIPEYAAELLDIQEYPQRLFYADYWPKPFANGDLYAESPQERCHIAAERIRHLAETGE